MSRTIYSTRAEALTAFGQQALPLTGLDGRERCAALPVWTELNRRIDEYLDSVSLEQVLRQSGQQ